MDTMNFNAFEALESAIHSYFSTKEQIVRLFFVFLSHRVFFHYKERQL